MGFFNRQKHPDGPVTDTTGHKTTKNHHKGNQVFYSTATRPTFGQWLKYTWLDIVTMVIMGVIGLGVRSVPDILISLFSWLAANNQ